MPNPWDVGSARALEKMGFQALATTSAGFAWTLGRPDNGVTLEDSLAHFGTIAASVAVPVNADFEGAFAEDPDQVYANVHLAVATGIAGVSVEDSTGDRDDLNRLVSRTALSHAGRPVKWLGDGVMVHFNDPGLGVVAALDMRDGVDHVGLPPAHVGIHAGPVLFQEGDYFGRTVNMAARIADYARPGEVLVTGEVVRAAEAADARGVAFREIGPVELKGIEVAVTLHAAERA